MQPERFIAPVYLLERMICCFPNERNKRTTNPLVPTTTLRPIRNMHPLLVFIVPTHLKLMGNSFITACVLLFFSVQHEQHAFIFLSLHALTYIPVSHFIIVA